MLILQKFFQILEETAFSNATYETIIIYYDTQTTQRRYRGKNKDKYPSRAQMQNLNKRLEDQIQQLYEIYIHDGQVSFIPKAQV